MGNVMIALDEEHELALRRLAQEQGSKKGALSNVVERALDKLVAEHRKKLIKERLKKRLTDGISFTYKMYQKRSEIYD